MTYKQICSYYFFKYALAKIITTLVHKNFFALVKLSRRGVNAFYTELAESNSAYSETVLHKVLIYIEYRAVSGVFRTIDPPTPSPPSECVIPPQQRRGGTPGRWGGGGLIFRKTPDIGLASYSIIPLRLTGCDPSMLGKHRDEYCPFWETIGFLSLCRLCIAHSVLSRV